MYIELQRLVEESALEQFLDSSDEEDSSSLSLSRPTASRTHQSSSVRPSRSECGGALPARAVLYIQMQLCENTLREWMQTPGRDGSIGVNRGYFVQVLQGLAHIHQASLIHRDLTPNNVFITHDKTFKIGDFGLSREMTDADSLAAPLDPVTSGCLPPPAPTPHPRDSCPRPQSAGTRGGPGCTAAKRLPRRRHQPVHESRTARML